MSPSGLSPTGCQSDTGDEVSPSQELIDVAIFKLFARHFGIDIETVVVRKWFKYQKEWALRSHATD